jgi:hypothetical protein
MFNVYPEFFRPLLLRFEIALYEINRAGPRHVPIFLTMQMKMGLSPRISPAAEFKREFMRRRLIGQPVYFNFLIKTTAVPCPGLQPCRRDGRGGPSAGLSSGGSSPGFSSVRIMVATSGGTDVQAKAFSPVFQGAIGIPEIDGHGIQDAIAGYLKMPVQEPCGRGREPPHRSRGS